jgi:transcriptional regulator with XRE-family HTH domain
MSSGKAKKKNAPPGRRVRLGPSVRSARKQRKLTLEQLSELAGVSKAMLSQIEQDKVNPTVAVMIRISSALGVPLADLLGDHEPRNVIRVIPHGQKGYNFRSDPSCTIRTLSPLELEKSIEFYKIVLAAGGELASESHFPGTEEIVHVARGRLEVASGREVVQVSRGDSLHYRADLPHHLKNLGKGSAEAYMIVRYRQD